MTPTTPPPHPGMTAAIEPTRRLPLAVLPEMRGPLRSGLAGIVALTALVVWSAVGVVEVTRAGPGEVVLATTVGLAPAADDPDSESPLAVVLAIAAPGASGIAVGQSANVRVPTGRGRRPGVLAARVTEVGSDRTRTVILQLDRGALGRIEDTPLFPGMPVEVVVVTGVRSRLALWAAPVVAVLGFGRRP